MTTDLSKLTNLTKAVLQVVKSVKGIDKSLTVGEGKSAYNGVADKDVKNIIGEAMTNAGLVILPIGIEPKTEVSRWEETSNYGAKQKQSVFTEVKTKYLLLHESGESIELEGYGHGVDSQDKSAGKATTYALKYTLLYTFLVPTGKIDDSENTHSDDLNVPGKAVPIDTTNAIKEAKTIADLTNIYNDCTNLHSNKDFMDLIGKRKQELKSKASA